MRKSRVRQFAEDREKQLASQIGEENRFRDELRRMLRQNKLAVFSAIVILLMILGAIFAPYLTHWKVGEMDLRNRLAPPSAAHWLGTDEGGRDIWTRILYGARVSLLVGVVPSLLAIALGTLLGILAGYRGGWADTVIMRLADITLALPSMLLAMVIMYTLGDGKLNMILTLTLVGWASVARVVRAEAMKLRNREFVEAARSIGVTTDRIMRRHILPNCIPTLIVLFTLNVPAAILTESSLSFLGLGIRPPDASWGQMINAGRQYLISAPWLCFAPGAVIMITVLTFNFLGDGLRDVLDPHEQEQ